MTAAPNRDQHPEPTPDPGRGPDTAGLGSRPVAEIMSHPVLALSADQVLDEALDALVRFGLRHLAVVDRSKRCLGIVADRMIVSAWASNMSCLSNRQVHELLDPEPAMVGRRASITDVARLMGQLGVDAVAVTDADGTLAGIVTGSDLVALLGRDA